MPLEACEINGFDDIKPEEFAQKWKELKERDTGMRVHIGAVWEVPTYYDYDRIMIQLARGGKRPSISPPRMIVFSWNWC